MLLMMYCAMWSWLSVFLLHSENGSLNLFEDDVNVSDVKGIILCECVMTYL